MNFENLSGARSVTILSRWETGGRAPSLTGAGCDPLVGVMTTKSTLSPR
jgi:hypothetical protein